MKILLTAFVPFDNNDTNYSHEVLKKIEPVPDLIKVELPVEYIGSFLAVKKLIEIHQPEYIVMLGEARGYRAVGFEVIGINEFSKYPDNNNYVPQTRFICDKGADGIFSTLDFDVFKKSFDDVGAPFYRSFSAGTYVCNAVLYQTLNYLQEHNPDIKAGFVHIPDLSEHKISDALNGLNEYIKNLNNL